ncbi:MAG: hypothetical protein KGL39_36745 [Patescibacteria group bacterium]|nr:hypothetical protein [Patescibacteria group bacterium]
MADKIKITLGEAAGPFSPALAKLAQLNLHSGRDAYALMRTEESLRTATIPYQKTMLALIQKHGGHGSLDELRAAVKKLRAPHPGPLPIGSEDFANAEREQQAADLEKKIAALEPVEQFTLTPADAGYAAFIAEAKELGEQAVELFLDHRVNLAVGHLPDGFFSPAEMRALEPIVNWQE